MALQSIVDKETGPVDAMSVVVTVYDDAGADVSASEAVSRAQIDAPADFFGVVQDVTPSVQRIAPYAVEVAINYRYRQLTTLKRPVPAETDETRDYAPASSAKQKELHSFLQVGTVYSSSGNVSADYPELRWPIDLPSHGGFMIATPGHLFSPLPGAFGRHYYAANANVTLAYLRMVAGMVVRGAFNDNTFLGLPAGTVQLVGFSANERTPDDWDLDFLFGIGEIRENVQVSSGITLPLVKANDYYWQKFKLLPIEQGGVVVQVIQQTEFVILGQVWPEEDFSQLNLE